MQFKATCSAIDYDKGEVTYTLADVEDIVNFELGPVVRIPSFEEYERPQNYNAQNYNALLESFADWAQDEDDLSDIKLCRDSGDQELARLFEAHDALTDKIGAHCRAKLSKGIVAQRTCSACTRTCDVGQKCWWCGSE
jgi:hypothetical protein